MITLAIIILVMGLFALYNTSQRAKLGSSDFEKWLQSNPRRSKTLSAASVLVALLLLIRATGFGAGVFYTLVAVMAILSLLILLVPLIQMIREN
ncbi:MAG: hypothetical protein AAF944_11460 [Bacteroidota bacterium]